MGKNCPESFVANVSHTGKAIQFARLIETANPELMILLASAATTGLLLIAFIQILRFVTFTLAIS